VGSETSDANRREQVGHSRAGLVVPMDREQKRQIRRKSMFGTALFALGITGAIAFAVTGSVWVIGAAGVLLVAGVVMLCEVSASLRNGAVLFANRGGPGSVSQVFRKQGIDIVADTASTMASF
jgi:hypothetical protein